MHTHSIDAYHENHPLLTGRRAQIYEYFRDHGQCTDRQVMKGLGFTDMNAVRPRITELCTQPPHLLEEVGETRCPVTGKRVRVVAPTRPKPEEQQDLPLPGAA